MPQRKELTRWAAIVLNGMALLSLLPVSVKGEHNETANPRLGSGCLTGIEAEATNRAQYRNLRVIDDPGTGHRWLLVEQISRPGAPALLVQIPSDRDLKRLGCLSETPLSRMQEFQVPIIHAGESIALSESSATLDVQLEGTALQSAQVGAALAVRLKVGGHLVHALATAPGRARVIVGGSWTRP